MLKSSFHDENQGIAMAHDVFISYSSKDKPVADAACATLESSGVRCWIAPRDVAPGVAYAESLVNGLSNSRLMVLVFSANSNRSPQVLREVERAVSKGLPILPLRIEDAPMSHEMEFYISSQHWLDALTPPLERHLSRLCESVKALLSTQHDEEHDPSREPARDSAAGHAESDSPITGPVAASANHAHSRKLLWWIGAGLVVAIAAAVFAIVAFKSRATSQLAEPASSGAHSGSPVFSNVNNELLSAASSGDTAAAARLLEQGADPDAKNNQGDTALLLAAKSGKVYTARLLIEKGANIEAKNNVGETALIAACTSGHAEIAQLLIDKGAAADARDDGGATPLMYAGLGGNTAIIDLLLARGANINAQDDRGETPLMYAASAGSVDAVKLMLRKNANPAAKDHNGQTALGYATQWNRPDVIQLLEHRNR